MKAVQLAAAVLLLGGLAACDDTREAESETPVAEAEVQTELPQTVVSDDALQQTADEAAAAASMSADAAQPAG